VYTASGRGYETARIDIGAYVYRRYSYHLKFDFFSNDASAGTGIDSLRISNVIQHSQRAMPFLVRGNNRFVVATGDATSTVSIAPRLTTSTISPDFVENETLTTAHATIHHIHLIDRVMRDDWSDQSCVVFPVSTPGDIVALRIGGVFRLAGAGDAVEFHVSYDGPESGFFPVHRAHGPSPTTLPQYITYDDVPPDTRRAWVKFRTFQSTEVLIIGYLRIDADYAEAGATHLPFKIRHEWTEDGVAMEHTEPINGKHHVYEIMCAGEPALSELTVWVDRSANPERRNRGVNLLYPNHPNPFNGSTTIDYYLARRSSVTLTVYDVSGTRVRRLVAAVKSAGLHTVGWDGKNDRGLYVGSGVYFFRLDVGEQTLARKALYLK
jgi:hypothetical protein